MPRHSAGLLLFRRTTQGIEVLLVHPGGPFWARKETAGWSIPKGEINEDEDPLHAAHREFVEEVGISPEGEALPLTPVRQKGGKIIHAWAMEAEFEPERLHSSTFQLEWPPHSGQLQEFPEVDRAAWFTIESAAERINPGQKPLLRELRTKLVQE